MPRPPARPFTPSLTSPSLLRWLLLAIPLLLWLAGSSLAFEYRPALPGYTYAFPRDHASHPDYKTEWWYYTGHLQTQAGQRYGYELTFFRVGLPRKDQPNPSPWSADNVYAAHFALSDEQHRTFLYSEKLNRAGVGAAGARTDAYDVWNELWLAEQLGDSFILRAETSDGKRALHLLLHPEKPPAIHGTNGVSQKADCRGCASHYYSMTRLHSEGLLISDGKAQPVQGLSWMDHEFGSNQLGKNQTGWDWFSIQLADGTDVMLYLLRDANGQPDPNSSGTVVDAQGHTRHLKLADFTVQPSGRTWTSPATHGTYPMGWQIRIPSADLQLDITPAFDNQELSTTGSTGVAYWEGSSHVQGRHRGQPTTGQAYVEMTGYAKRFASRI